MLKTLLWATPKYLLLHRESFVRERVNIKSKENFCWSEIIYAFFSLVKKKDTKEEIHNFEAIIKRELLRSKVRGIPCH